MTLREDADAIIEAALRAAQPERAVTAALRAARLGAGRVRLVAIGKAAWQMAHAAHAFLGQRIERGIVITKYGHAKGSLPRTDIWEAGHPVPDENSFRATRAALALVRDLAPEDTVLFLISGGGSALFEAPLVPPEELAALTQQLLACGASITEINTLRKRLSGVKGGQFGALCAPAHVVCVALSDVLGDRPDIIASGPAYPDATTAAEALAIVQRYRLTLSPEAQALLSRALPAALPHVETHIAGSVRLLCRAAQQACTRLGYRTTVLTETLCCAARDAGSFLASVAQYNSATPHALAFLAGGETVVRVTGQGLGGRNQELALAAAEGMRGLANTAVFSFGSDGTDGPTDAAGGYCDGTSADTLAARGISVAHALAENDSYHALAQCGGLLVTGPTGTNVNDLSALLIKR